MKKFLCMIMSLVFFTTTFSMIACSQSGNGIDPTKLYLKVAIVNTGYGTAYAEEMEQDFEEYYSNLELPSAPGKKGVDIELSPGMSEFGGATLLDTLSTRDETVFMLMGNTAFNDYISRDLLVDLSETVEAKIYDKDGNFAADTGNEAKYSIEDLMADGYSEIERYVNGKCYGVPFMASMGGVIYDADLFNKYKLFYDENGRIGANFEDIAKGECSTGPDGKLGTYDDGMPKTLTEFSSLMSYMVGKNIIPFAFAGALPYVKNIAYQALHAGYEGYDNFMLNYTFNGTDTNLGNINPSNYNKLLDQEGRKYAMKFFYEIAKNDKYTTEFSRGGSSQTQAQDEFVKSIDTNNPIAFFMEGGWWEIEAITTFNDMAATDENWGYGKRDFRLMPYPNVENDSFVADKKNDYMTMLANAQWGTNIFISNVSTAEDKEIQIELGKLFVQFINRRDQIIDFTKNTGGCIRCVDVPKESPYTEEELSSLTKFGRSIYEYLNDGAKIAYTAPIAKLRLDNPAGYGTDDNGWCFAGEYFGGSASDPFSLIKSIMKEGVHTNVYDILYTAFTHSKQKINYDWTPGV